VYTFYTNNIIISGLDQHKTYFFSVANVSNGVESLFCNEYAVLAVGLEPLVEQDREIRLLPNSPNPFSNRTQFTVEAGASVHLETAALVIRDIMGRQIQVIPWRISPGMNRLDFTNSRRLQGIYTYSLYNSGVHICTRKMAICID
jgi:hypothetical protein